MDDNGPHFTGGCVLEMIRQVSVPARPGESMGTRFAVVQEPKPHAGSSSVAMCRGPLEGEWAAGGKQFQERRRHLSLCVLLLVPTSSGGFRLCCLFPAGESVPTQRKCLVFLFGGGLPG